MGVDGFEQQRYELRPIGRIVRSDNGIRVVVLDRFRPAIQLLDRFTHLIVVWWADKHDDEKSRAVLQCEPPYAPGRVHGIFATRAEYRPNPIAITTCKMLSVDERDGVIQVADIDALDGTPVVDLKPYYPVCERVQDARIPEWLSDWPEWMPEEGLGL
jgi:tRNA-Thr(GGU) m(6)t(6)A37 methyltransferase TsaA